MDPEEQTTAKREPQPFETLRVRHNLKDNLWLYSILLTLVSVICFLAAAVESGASLSAPWFAKKLHEPCRYPPVRREWRSLGSNEKKRFTKAVQCLWDTPSKFREEGSVYDDLVYMHRWTGQFCMFTRASFGTVLIET